MGRSIYCSKCGEEKDKSFLTSGYCRKCKLESIAARRAKARLERGQLPFGEGRRPTCYECGAIKENPLHGYCNSCHAAKDRARRAINKQSSVFVKEERQKHLQRSKSDPIYTYKKTIRHITNKYIKMGILVRQSCEVCKSDKKADAHHDDYNKPLEVRWLCRKHHNEHHRIYGEGKLPSQFLI